MNCKQCFRKHSHKRTISIPYHPKLSSNLSKALEHHESRIIKNSSTLFDYYSVATHFRNFSGEPKNKFSQKPFWRSHKYFAYMSIIIKLTYCQNLRVERAIVLVLFKLLYCSTDKFMNNIIFCHTKYVVMKGIKKLKKLIYPNNCMGNCNRGFLDMRLFFCNRKP
jgi:hypothetical protein